MPEFPHGALHEMKQFLIVIDDSYAHFYPIELPANAPSTPTPKQDQQRDIPPFPIEFKICYKVLHWRHEGRAKRLRVLANKGAARLPTLRGRTPEETMKYLERNKKLINSKSLGA
jgi:hypothetical protein